jgi:uncharacterized protein (DUF58 family)
MVLCLGIGAAALNTGNNLLYLVFGMMCAFLLLSGVLSNNTLSRIAVVPYFPARIFAGEVVPVHIDLINHKRWFPSFAFSLHPTSSDVESSDRVFVLKLPVSKKEAVTNHVRFPRRGRTTLPAYEVETAYPFGLIRKYITVPSQGETIIYPPIIDIDPWLAFDHRLHGEFLSNRKGESSNPYGIREFVYGDPSRLIHWKTSARRGEWMVKEFEREKRMKVVLNVLLAPDKESDPVWLEKAISAAASIILALSVRGFEMLLLLNGQAVEPAGKGYLDAYLTAIALAHPSTESDLTRPYRVSDDATSVVISDLPRSKLRSHGLLTLAKEDLGAL